MDAEVGLGHPPPRAGPGASLSDGGVGWYRWAVEAGVVVLGKTIDAVEVALVRGFGLECHWCFPVGRILRKGARALNAGGCGGPGSAGGHVEELCALALGGVERALETRCLGLIPPRLAVPRAALGGACDVHAAVGDVAVAH